MTADISGAPTSAGLNDEQGGIGVATMAGNFCRCQRGGREVITPLSRPAAQRVGLVLDRGLAQVMQQSPRRPITAPR